MGAFSPINGWACVYSMCLQYVFTVCVYSMCLHYIFTVCIYIMFLLYCFTHAHTLLLVRVDVTFRLSKKIGAGIVKNANII